MRRLLVAVLAAMLVLGSATAAEAGWRSRECRFQYLDGHKGWSKHDVTRTIDCAAEKWHVDRSRALAIAKRESGFGHDILNNSSGACGVYQFYPCSSFRTRLHRVASAVPRLKRYVWSYRNARSTVMAAVWEMHKSGFGAWS